MARINIGRHRCKEVLSGMMIVLMLGCRPTHEGKVMSAADTSETIVAATSNGRWEPELIDLQSRKLRPFDDLEVKAIVFVFVLQDCPIANSYVPEINRLYESFEPRGIQFVMVHADPEISLEAARKHAEQYQLRLPVVVDSHHRWVNRARATKTPEAVVFSPQGVVLYRGRIDDRYVALGKRRAEATSHDLADSLEAILAGRPVPREFTEAVGCFIPELSQKGQ